MKQKQRSAQKQLLQLYTMEEVEVTPALAKNLGLMRSSQECDSEMPQKSFVSQVIEGLQKNPYDQELHSALVSGYRESAALEKLRTAREEAASLVTWRLEMSVMEISAGSGRC
eukprot:Skav225124  [mRNA]  locus=scaffold1239:330888:339858:- [translate_table: standard]